MGIELSQYRASVGYFYGKKGSKENLILYPKASKFAHLFHNNYLFHEWEFVTRHKWSLFVTKMNRNNNYRGCHMIHCCMGISLFIHLSCMILLCGDIHQNPGPQDYADISICHSNIQSLRAAPEKLDHISLP